MLLSTQYPTYSIFLFGDSNFPYNNWNNPTHVWSKNFSVCQQFIYVILDFNLSQIVFLPEWVSPPCSNILYIVLTSHPKLFPTPLVLLDGISDHKWISLCIKVKKKTQKLFVQERKCCYTTKAITKKETEHSVAISFFFLNYFDLGDVNEKYNLFKNKLDELLASTSHSNTSCLPPRNHVQSAT